MKLCVILYLDFTSAITLKFQGYKDGFKTMLNLRSRGEDRFGMENAKLAAGYSRTAKVADTTLAERTVK